MFSATVSGSPVDLKTEHSSPLQGLEFHCSSSADSNINHGEKPHNATEKMYDVQCTIHTVLCSGWLVRVPTYLGLVRINSYLLSQFFPEHGKKNIVHDFSQWSMYIFIIRLCVNGRTRNKVRFSCCLVYWFLWNVAFSDRESNYKK